MGNTISSVAPKMRSGGAHRPRDETRGVARQSYVCSQCLTSSRPGLLRSLSYHQRPESVPTSGRRLEKEQKKVGSTKTERCESKRAICQSRATQTEPEQYDYAYSE